MPTSPSISVSLIHALLNAYSRLAREEGLPVIAPVEINVVQGRVDANIWHEIVSKQARVLGDELLGIRIARLMSVRDFPGFTELFWVARTVQDAFDAVRRYTCIYSEECCFSIEIGEVHSRIVLKNDRIDSFSHHVVEAIMMLLNRYAKHLGGEGFQRLTFRHCCPIGSYRDYENIFRLPVEFGKEETSFTFNSQWLAMPLSQTVEPSFELLGTAERYLATLKRSQPLRNQIRYILQKMLVTGDVSSKKVADALGMSLRTFQRRLKDEGVIYKDVLEDVRRELAIEYLSRACYSVHDVAYLVGYNDVRNFFRGFKSWTGKKPGDYRREALRSNYV